MSTHTMPHQANPTKIKPRLIRRQRRWELFRQIAIHLVALAPGLLRRVDVETRARPEVIGVILSFDIQASYPGPSRDLSAGELGIVQWWVHFALL